MSAEAEAALEELCNRVGGGKRHFEQILQHLREADSRSPGDLERQLGLVLMEDAEADDCEDDFPCPGCDDDFDLPTLCSHMEEDHPELLEEEVECPVCGRLVRKDVVGHMLSEHVQFSKDRSRRRSGRASSLVESLSLLTSAARKGSSGLMVDRGGGTASHRKHPDESFLPALAESLIAEEAAKARESEPVATLNPSVGANWTAEERQEQHEQAVLRARFVQGLVMSTLLKDS